MENVYLQHHGVKGMKWGVIRNLSKSKPIQSLTKSYVTPKKKPKMTAFDKEYAKRYKNRNSWGEVNDILSTAGTTTAYKSLQTAGMKKDDARAVSLGINAVALAVGYGLRKAGVESPVAITASIAGSKYVAEMATYNLARNSYNKKYQS